MRSMLFIIISLHINFSTYQN